MPGLSIVHRQPLLAAGIIILTLIFSSSDLLGQWSELPGEIGPAGTSSAFYGASAAYDGRLYYFGGLNGSTQVPPVAQVLDPESGNGWENVTPLPVPVYSMIAEEYDGKIYILGGYGFQTQISQGQVFDPVTASYSTTSPWPRTMLAAGSAVVGNRILIVGGLSTSTYAKDVVAYNPVTNSWSTAGSGPYQASDPAVAAIGNTIYVVGGRDPQNKTVPLAYKGTVNQKAITWERIADYPVPILGASAGILNGKLLIAGGSTDNIATNRCMVYDEESDSWVRSYTLPVSTFHAVPSMPVVDDTPYFIGGIANRKAFRLQDGGASAVADLSKQAFYEVLLAGESKDFVADLSNLGIEELSAVLTVSKEAKNWLSVPASFSIAPGMAEPVALSADASELDPGTYRGTVTVATNDPNHATLEVQITLFVREELRNVRPTIVLEESTGTWCGPCGLNGEPKKLELAAQYGDDLIILAYHSGDQLSTSETEKIISKLRITSFPTAMTQRFYGPDLSAGWDYSVSEALNREEYARAVIDLADYEFEFNSGTSTGTVSASLQFTVDRPVILDGRTLHVTAVVTEDGYMYPQAGIDLSTYTHKRAVRNFWPDIDGQPLNIAAETVLDDNVIIPGTVLTTTATFPVTNVVDPKKAHIAFLLHLNDGDLVGPIIQAKERKLMDGASSSGVAATTEATGSLQLAVNAPGPAGDMARIHFAVPARTHAVLELFDITGRPAAYHDLGIREAGRHSAAIDVAALLPGSYVVHLTTDNGNETARIMTIVR